MGVKTISIFGHAPHAQRQKLAIPLQLYSALVVSQTDRHSEWDVSEIPNVNASIKNAAVRVQKYPLFSNKQTRFPLEILLQFDQQPKV